MNAPARPPVPTGGGSGPHAGSASRLTGFGTEGTSGLPVYTRVLTRLRALRVPMRPRETRVLKRLRDARDAHPSADRALRLTGHVLAAVLVLGALLMPNTAPGLRPDRFTRIPAEAIVGAVLLLALPRPAARGLRRALRGGPRRAHRAQPAGHRLHRVPGTRLQPGPRLGPAGRRPVLRAGLHGRLRRRRRRRRRGTARAAPGGRHGAGHGAARRRPGPAPLPRRPGRPGRGHRVDHLRLTGPADLGAAGRLRPRGGHRARAGAAGGGHPARRGGLREGGPDRPLRRHPAGSAPAGPARQGRRHRVRRELRPGGRGRPADRARRRPHPRLPGRRARRGPATRRAADG